MDKDENYSKVDELREKFDEEDSGIEPMTSEDFEFEWQASRTDSEITATEGKTH